MSIENNLASIAKSLERIATAVEAKCNTSDVVVATPAAAQVAMAQATSPAPVVTPPVAAMPAAPAFMAPPAAAPVALVAPFTDAKGLMDYVMGAYKTMGPEKGAGIQGVLTGMGYANINDVKPEHYGALFAGVEALK